MKKKTKARPARSKRSRAKIVVKEVPRPPGSSAYNDWWVSIVYGRSELALGTVDEAWSWYETRQAALRAARRINKELCINLPIKEIPVKRT